MNNQRQDIVKFLSGRKKGITNYEAVVLLGIMCFWKRKQELEDEGYIFKDQWEERFGKRGLKRYKRYWLVKVPNKT
jgi:hypothetical protein